MAYNWTKSLRKTCQTLFKLIVHNWLKQFLYSHAFTPDFSFQNAAKWEWEYQLRLVPLINADNLWTHQWCWKCTRKFAVTGSCKVKVEMWTSYNGNALKLLFQFVNTSFDCALSDWFLLISPDFSSVLRLPWIIIDTHPSISCDLSILIDLNFDFIDLSIRFSMINFDRFVTPCYKNSRPWKMIPCSSALTHFLVFLSNPQLTNTSEYEWVPIAIGRGKEVNTRFSMGPSSQPGPVFGHFLFNAYFSSQKWFWIKSNCFQR